MGYRKDTPIYRFIAPGTKFIVLGSVLLLLSGFITLIKIGLSKLPLEYFEGASLVENMIHSIGCVGNGLLGCGIAVIAVGTVWRLNMSNATDISLMIRKGLFSPSMGNPLRLKEGQKLPRVTCKDLGHGRYELTITATSVTVEDIQGISSNISSYLKQKFERYAVTQTDADLAFNAVTFLIEDITANKSLVIYNPEELKRDKPTLIPVQKETDIDLTTSGSILVAGKTRSGKTTAVVSMLISALEWGRDNFGSEIIVIDPKQAELSQLPYVYTLDENGDAKEILQAIQRFADTIKQRQKVLNALSRKKGDAVKWWDAGMNVSFLFIDEYVALRSLFPKRITKETSGYNLAEFDNLIKRIVTTGASAGCYVILSIAEASVEEGGLPAMIRSAMSTKILFRPTMPEARLMWSTEKLQDFNAKRNYSPGDAWFSSTDGVHDNVSYVHFPIMRFPPYKELGRLLKAYYES